MAPVYKLTKDTEKNIIEAITDVLRNSGIVIVPTDTVYGLVCDGENDFAKENIYKFKNRPVSKPLIAFVRNIAQARKIACIQEASLDFIMRRWPGKNTFVFKSKIESKYLVSSSKTIGIRIPDFHLINQLCEIFSYLASTSANISFTGSASSIDEIEADITNRVSLIVDAGKLCGRESAIWDMTESPPKLVRGRILFVCSGNSCRSPMAQFILKQILSGIPIDVISAGTSTIASGRPSREAVEAMREMGIVVDDFITQQLTEKIIDSSDLIFVMEEKHRSTILQMSSASCDKIILLDIPDPAGKDISHYREIRDLIKDKIKKQVLTRIKK